jgi:hypothetical protein
MDDRQEKGDTRMKGREARPRFAVARAIGGVAAAAMLVAVVLGAGPRVAHSADATFTVGGKTITCTVTDLLTTRGFFGGEWSSFNPESVTSFDAGGVMPVFGPVLEDHPA